jgi:hypothetical protein
MMLLLASYSPKSQRNFRKRFYSGKPDLGAEIWQAALSHFCFQDPLPKVVGISWHSLKPLCHAIPLSLNAIPPSLNTILLHMTALSPHSLLQAQHAMPPVKFHNAKWLCNHGAQHVPSHHITSPSLHCTLS